MWSTPSTTGEAPRPCLSFSFVKMSDSTVVLFGGETDYGHSDDLYTLDMNNMVSTCELCTDNTYYLADVLL